MIRFLHTADLQLGKAFRDVPGDQGARLRACRLEAIQSIARVARERQAQFVLIAGDLFDAHTVDDRTVTVAAHHLSAIGLPVLVIPGNHDPGGDADAVFKKASFRAACGGRVQVLLNQDPVPLLNGSVIVLPCPLIARHTLRDTTDHLTNDFGRDVAPTGVRIGLAHGAVIDFTREEEGATNVIDPNRASVAGLDYLALGDWHGALRVHDRAWYSGTPEPDRFKNNDSGNVLVVELDGPGAVPRVDKVRVAQTQWVEHAAVLHSEEDVAVLSDWGARLEPPTTTLLRLTLEGALSFAGAARLEALLAQWGNLFLLLKREGGVRSTATTDELSAIATAGPLKAAVDRLVAVADGASDQAGDAALALQLLHRMATGATP
jgi:DNA repair exonuclease SbcCD nuclease subunit